MLRINAESQDIKRSMPPRSNAKPVFHLASAAICRGSNSFCGNMSDLAFATTLSLLSLSVQRRLFHWPHALSDDIDHVSSLRRTY